MLDEVAFVVAVADVAAAADIVVADYDAMVNYFLNIIHLNYSNLNCHSLSSDNN